MKQLISERFGNGTKNDSIRNFLSKGVYVFSYFDVFLKRWILRDETTQLFIVKTNFVELNSCLPGHVTGLLFCPDEKVFLSFIFNSVDFETVCHALYLKLSLQINISLRSWEFFTMRTFRDTFFSSAKMIKPESKLSGEQEKYMDLFHMNFSTCSL